MLRLLKKISSYFLVQRLLISGLTYLAMLGLAKNLGASLYGNLAFLIFILKSFPAFNFGLSYGYIFYAYSSESENYLASYIYGYLLIGLSYIIISGLLVDPLIFLYGPILLVLFIVEPIFKLRKYFLFSLYPEFFLNIAFLFAYYICGKNYLGFQITALSVLVILNFLILFRHKGVLRKIKNSVSEWQIANLGTIAKLVLNNIIALIQKGFNSYLYLLIIFGFLFLDRTLLKNTFSASALGTCMLAFQMSQAALYLMSTANFSSIIEIGELIKKNEFNKNFILRKLLLAALMGLGPMIFIYILLKVFAGFFNDFTNLSLVFLIIGVGLFFSNLVNSISPILFFFRKQTLASIGTLFCLGVILVSYGFASKMNWDYLYVLTINYFALAISSIFTICYSLHIAFGVSAKKESFA